MKKFFIETNNINPNFIGSWTIEPLSICRDLISYFECNLAKQIRGGTLGGVDPNVKDSIDINIKPKEIMLPGNEAFKSYFEELLKCYKNYIEEWPFLKDLAQKTEISSFNLQRYKPGQHFKKIHSE